MFAVLASASLLFGQESETSPEIVDQRDFQDSINGCGPASILNLLRFSRPEYQAVESQLIGAKDSVRMRFLVDRYFRNRPSVVYPAQKRWGVHGILSADLVTGLNELLEENGVPELSATYLDRESEETESDHLERIYETIAESLENGVAPILSVRSFVVRHRDDKGPAWEAGWHHNVVIREIEETKDATGFALKALDPFRGKEVAMYIHIEGSGQSFRALKGIQESGNWLNGRPFLQVLAPDLPTIRPQNVTWSERFIVVANFLIGDF